MLERRFRIDQRDVDRTGDLVHQLDLLARIGSYGVAAFTIINYAAWFGASVSYAISDSLSPLVSANFGARNFARARQFLGLALGMVFGIGLMLYGLFALYPEMLLKIFLPVRRKWWR